MSSAEVAVDEEEELPIMQAGDPYLEKLLMEACLDLVHLDSLVGIQDMGAAGLTSASAEMAAKAGFGVELNMDLVPQREEGMTAYEMMLSESQERMLIVIKAGHEQEVIDLFDRYGIHACAIGHVTDDKMLRLVHHGEVVAELPVDPLAEDNPVYHKPSREPEYFRKFQEMTVDVPKVDNHLETLQEMLTRPTIASKEWVYRQFDSHARGNTVIPPGSSAGIIRVDGTNKGLAMTSDCNSRYIYLDPETGGQIAVAEAARNLVCSGAEPLAITDCLNFGSPDNPEVFWQLEKSADGISAACRTLDTPVIGGNVSLSNEVNGKAVKPTPTIGMVGLVKQLEHVVTEEAKRAGDLVYVIGEAEAEFGGSELQQMLDGDISGQSPTIDLEVEKKRQQQVLQAIQKGLVQSATDVSEGGLSIALLKTVFGTNFGLDVTLEGDATVALFSETQSRFVITVAKENQEAFEQIATDAILVGEVTEEATVQMQGTDGNVWINASKEQLQDTWKGALECLLNSKN